MANCINRSYIVGVVLNWASFGAEQKLAICVFGTLRKATVSTSAESMLPRKMWHSVRSTGVRYGRMARKRARLLSAASS